jgi:hypothetical protein
MRVRKVLREIGVPSRVGNSRSSGPQSAVGDVSRELVEKLGRERHGARLVLLEVGLGQHPLSGGGVLQGDLDDGLLHGHPAGGEVEVAGFEGDELAPAQAGVDRGLDHQPVLGGRWPDGPRERHRARAEEGLDPGTRCRRWDPRGWWHCRADRPARPVHVAARDAGHRAPRTTPPRRAAVPVRGARDGWRYQAFVTNTTVGQLASLEARHRAHARVEDRIRHAKDSGLGRFPSREFDINQTWLGQRPRGRCPSKV